MKLFVPALLLYASGALAQSAAVVEGAVTDSVTHAGVSGVSVTLWKNGQSYKATTDSSGTFVIGGVNPGEYNYRFEKNGYESRELPVFGQPRLRVGTAGTFRADAEIAALATLRGRVLDPEGKPAAKAIIELPLDRQDTDTEGRFEFHNVRPGDYILRAVPQENTSDAVQTVPTYYPSTISRGEAEHIRVRAGADLAGYEIRLRTSPVYHVRGTVFDENGKPQPGANVRVLGPGEKRLLSGVSLNMVTGTRAYLNSLGAKQEETATIAAKDGTFHLSVRPGDWSLQAELDPQHDSHNNLYFVSSDEVPISVSDHDIENVELRFSPVFALEITADWGDRQPAGGRSRPRVMVTPSGGLSLMPARPEGGKLLLEHVLPGNYRIVPTLGSTPGYYAAAIMIGGRNVLGEEVELTAATPSIQVVYRPNPGSVRGTVNQGEGATVLLWPEGPDIPEFVPAVVAGSRGEFEFRGVPPGEYVLVAFDRVPPNGGTEAFVRGAIAGGTRVQVQEGGSESVQVPVTHWPD
ncbi:MAG TPA: carboxypeptidase regulatory-like domain-containing protein [Bryobacteraceae bacterium]|jgi:protocatechuate 3,4-dioxygenase beta subunit